MSHDPLRQILSQSRSYWDRDETRPAVRWAFRKALQCRTAELGGEVYASENCERVFFHTCKSRCCSSCGYRATMQWQRERWATLPQVFFKGITFTMPDVLWPIFRDNPRLAKALPALAAKLIQTRATAKYNIQLGIIAILHTFNSELNYNSHVHTMITGGGLHATSGRWFGSIYYDRSRLMESWRMAVIRLLRAALQAGQLRTSIAVDHMEVILAQQENRWWSLKIQSFDSKGRFLRYAGRYVRRPPIAQHRITFVGKQSVTFLAKDKRLHRRRSVQCSLEEFIQRWAQHIPERYQHVVRCFGLFAPRSLGKTSDAIFAILKQDRRPRPKRRRWADSLRVTFGQDPLLDPSGKKMKWARRVAPTTSR